MVMKHSAFSQSGHSTLKCCELVLH
uniref:Uncharacterized protein n=1 Tax=Arundo donax TaxID=35708 RepID=A0A0A9A9P3_ARUDO